MTAQTTTKRHPIRGGLYGIILGLGLALLLIGRKIVTLDSALPIVVLVIGIVVGVLWGLVAPPKKPKGPAPRTEAPAAAPSAAEPVADEPATAEPAADEAGAEVPTIQPLAADGSAPEAPQAPEPEGGAMGDTGEGDDPKE